MPQRFNRDLFLQWRDHPLTEVFRQYLLDQRETLGKAWMAGQPLSEAHQIKALLLGELADLDWDDVRQFYERPEEEAA